MSEVSFKCTEKQRYLVKLIVDRGFEMGAFSKPYDRDFVLDAPDYYDEHLSRTMDILATNANGCPLELDAFCDSDDFNFAHDFVKISYFIDRNTGQMLSNFVPRFAK